MQTLAQALAAAASKFKPALVPEHCALHFNKKPVDLHTPFRLLNVPAGSKLEVLIHSKCRRVERMPSNLASVHSLWTVSATMMFHVHACMRAYLIPTLPNSIYSCCHMQNPSKRRGHQLRPLPPPPPLLCPMKPSSR